MLRRASMRVSNVWQWEGRVNRTAYFFVGLAAFVLKFLLDWIVVTRVFHRPWSLLNYWRPFGAISGVHALSLENRLFAGAMLFLALPFIWLGLVMTVKRLRDAGEPTWLAALFFAPIANLAFFLVLSLKPSAKGIPLEEGAPWPGPHFLERWIPRTQAASALVSIGVTAMLGLGFTLLGTQVVAQYGWGLFVGLPFCLGLFAVLTHSYHEPRGYGECLPVAILPIAILGAILFLVAIEGAVCLAMAAPLASLLALLGGSLGEIIQGGRRGRRNTPAMVSMAVLLTPGFYGVEHFVRPQAGVFEVKSAIEINAPPKKVWGRAVACGAVRAGGGGAAALCVWAGAFCGPHRVGGGAAAVAISRDGESGADERD